MTRYTHTHTYIVVVVQLLSCVWLFAINCSTPSFPVLNHLMEFSQTHVQQCHPSISSSVMPFSSGPLYFPASGSFPVSQHFTSGSQKHQSFQWILVNPLELTGFISLLSKGLTSLLQHHRLKTSILQPSAFFTFQLTSIHHYWKNCSFDYMDLCRQSDVCFWICCLGLS